MAIHIEIHVEVQNDVAARYQHIVKLKNILTGMLVVHLLAHFISCHAHLCSVHNYNTYTPKCGQLQAHQPSYTKTRATHHHHQYHSV